MKVGRHASSVDNLYQYSIKNVEQAYANLDQNVTDEEKGMLSEEDQIIKSDIVNTYKLKFSAM